MGNLWILLEGSYKAYGARYKVADSEFLPSLHIYFGALLKLYPILIPTISLSKKE